MGKAKVMGLLDDLNDKKQLQSFTGSFCTMCELLGKLPKDEAEILQARLDDRSIAGTRIAVILKKNGYPMAEGTLQRHRNGNCRGIAR